jgi:hypothetical protein
LKFDYVVENDSTSTVKALVVEVYEHISFNAKRHSESHKNAIFSKRIEASSLSGIEKLKDIKDSTGPDYNRLNDILRDGLNSIQIEIPSSTRTDYLGHHAFISHTVVASMRTPFCVDDPEIHVNLQVNGGNRSFTGEVPEVTHEFALPKDWMATPSAPVFMGNTRS